MRASDTLRCMLPSCFKPTAECRVLLERVRDGYNVEHIDAIRYMDAGFIKPTGPSAGSGYALTDKGREALNRG